MKFEMTGQVKGIWDMVKPVRAVIEAEGIPDHGKDVLVLAVDLGRRNAVIAHESFTITDGRWPGHLLKTASIRALRPFPNPCPMTLSKITPFQPQVGP